MHGGGRASWAIGGKSHICSPFSCIYLFIFSRVSLHRFPLSTPPRAVPLPSLICFLASGGTGGGKRDDAYAGWDLLLGAGSGMGVWMGLVLGGAVAIGTEASLFPASVLTQLDV